MSVERPFNSDSDRLMKVITSLADGKELNETRGRQLATGQMPSIERLFALLREIDETVLHRTLKINSEGKSEIWLDVVERRVVRIKTPIVPEHLELEDLEGKPLNREDAVSLFRVLGDFCLSSLSLHVVSEVSDDEGLASFAGVTIETLQQLYRVKCAAQQLAPRELNAVFETVRRSIACIVCQQGRRLLSHGDRKNAEALLQLMPPTTMQDVEKQVNIWIGRSQWDRAVLRTCCHDLTCIALFRTDDLDIALNAWTKND